MTTCGEVLAQLMDAYGIETAFGIPGTHTIELYRGLPQTRIRHITPRHEQGAGFMADGYARVTGKPAACLTVSGPGAYNIATAMGQALQDSVPMLVISADNNSYEKGLGEGRLHETRDISAAMAECSRWHHTLARVDELPKVMARAFAIFNSTRPGPVHLTIPLDVITAKADHVQIQTWPTPSRPAPSPDALKAAAELLASAKSPVIAVGGGAVDAANEILTLATALNAPVTSTQNGKGIMPKDHPLYVFGSPSFPSHRKLYEEADVIIGIGTEFGETDYDFFFKGDLKLGGQLIRIDIDFAQLTRSVYPKIAIQADAKMAVTALLPLLHNTASVTGLERAEKARVQQKASNHTGYQAFFDAIQEALPDAILVADSTQPAYFASHQYDAPRPRSFACAATGYGTLGYGLPAAFGAKLGQPERPVISLMGDGGIQFTLSELASAVEAEIPVAIIIWNNYCYGQIAMNFRDAGMEPIACDIYTPDFLKIAEGYGCPATRATTLDELQQQLRNAQDRKVPTVIEVREADFI